MIFGWAVKKEAGTKHTQMLLLLQIFYGIGPTSEGEKQSTLHDPRLKKTTHDEWRKKRSKLNSKHFTF